jgi:hypothetical protein
VFPLATAGPSAYWYLTRSTGTVALILLTLSVALGVANIRRLQSERVPRFVLDAVHRNVSLLAMVFLLIHIVTSVLDSFAHISVLDVVIPFTGTYRPLWLGLGALGFDLMAAVTITSLVRHRFGYRAWRITHWAAYASWPLALLHGLGTGSDTKAGWMLVIVAACVILTAVAVVARATAGWPEHAVPRLGALGASALVPLGLIVWLPSGPLAKGWAKRAGTPSTLLGAAPTAARSVSRITSTSIPFTAAARGTIRQGPRGSGTFGVDISLSLVGETLNTVAIHLRGQAIGGGGLQMSSSQVTLGSPSNPSMYRGQATGLQGTDVAATLADSSGARVSLSAHMAIDQSTGAVSGTVTVTR